MPDDIQISVTYKIVGNGPENRVLLKPACAVLQTTMLSNEKSELNRYSDFCSFNVLCFQGQRL